MTQRRHYPSVDGLKGLLILLIVLHNLLPNFPAAGASGRVIDAIPLTAFLTIYGGSLGNSLFFMLSGFLMSTGYKDSIQERRICFSDFFRKRLWKLYPMYILSNAVMLVVSILKYGPSAVNLKRILATALLQLGGGLAEHPYNGPSWFLSALFLCYILYFAVTYFSSHSTRYLFSLGICVLAGYAMMEQEWSLSVFNTGNGQGLTNFFLGCILAELLPVLRQKQRRWLPAACILALGGSFYLMLRYGVEIIAGDSRAAFSFLVAPALLYLTLDCGWIRRLLEAKPVQLLGGLSLCIFFWHYPVFEILAYLFSLCGAVMTELYFPLYLIVLLVFCKLYPHIPNHNAPSGRS